MHNNVAIVGVGETKYATRVKDANYAEQAHEATVKALEAANMTINDIDAVVFSEAPDTLEGIDAIERWCVGAVGGRNKPFMRIHTGGTTGGKAVNAAYSSVASGLFETVLAVGAARVAESPPGIEVIFARIFDQNYERGFSSRYPKGFGYSTVLMAAFQALCRIHKYGETDEQRAHVAARLRRNAQNNPHAHLTKELTMKDALESPMVAYPLRLSDCCPRSSGGCAVILASEEKARKITDTPAWIKGAATKTGTVFQGHRIGSPNLDDWADFAPLALAARDAYKMAGIDNPRQQVDVAEIYAPFTNCELAAIEALGFCQKGEAGRLEEEGMFEMSGELPVSPSGGTLSSNPIAVTAMVRVADAALQVMGKAGKMQVENVETAVATGIGGTWHLHSITVLAKKL